jgi:hypothetical protein
MLRLWRGSLPWLLRPLVEKTFNKDSDKTFRTAVQNAQAESFPTHLHDLLTASQEEALLQQARSNATTLKRPDAKACVQKSQQSPVTPQELVYLKQCGAVAKTVNAQCKLQVSPTHRRWTHAMTGFREGGHVHARRSRAPSAHYSSGSGLRLRTLGAAT